MTQTQILAAVLETVLTALERLVDEESDDVPELDEVAALMGDALYHLRKLKDGTPGGLDLKAEADASGIDLDDDDDDDQGGPRLWQS
jgi:hypothetical protein